MRDKRPHPIDIPGFRTLGTVFKVVLLLALAAFGVFALFSVCTFFAAVNMERRDWKVEEMNAARGQLPPHRERIASIAPQWTPDGSLIALGHMGDIYTVAPDDAASCSRRRRRTRRPPFSQNISRRLANGVYEIRA